MLCERFQPSEIFKIRILLAYCGVIYKKMIELSVTSSPRIVRYPKKMEAKKIIYKIYKIESVYVNRCLPHRAPQGRLVRPIT